MDVQAKFITQNRFTVAAENVFVLVEKITTIENEVTVKKIIEWLLIWFKEVLDQKKLISATEWMN